MLAAGRASPAADRDPARPQRRGGHQGHALAHHRDRRHRGRPLRLRLPRRRPDRVLAHRLHRLQPRRRRAHHPSRLPAMVLTPICPHMLTNRPLVISDEAVVELRLRHADDGAAHITFDGQRGFPLSAGDSVRVTRTARTVRLVKAPGRDYFEVLRTKLKWGRPPVVGGERGLGLRAGAPGSSARRARRAPSTPGRSAPATSRWSR